MEVQPSLVLLQKTLLNIEGLGRQIYPDLDLWKTAKPFLENWMNEQIGTRALFKGFKKNLPYLAEKMPEMPELMYQALKKISEGENHQQQTDELKKIRQQLENNQRKSLFTIAGSALLICSVLLLSFEFVGQPQFMQLPVISWVLALPGAAMIWFGLRR